MLVTVRHTHTCNQTIAARLQGQSQCFAIECDVFVIQRLKHRSVPLSDGPRLIVFPCASILRIQCQNRAFCLLFQDSSFCFHTVEGSIVIILRLQGHWIQSCRYIETPADCHKQNLLRQRTSLFHRKDTDRCCHDRVILFFCMEGNILLKIIQNPFRLLRKAVFCLFLKKSADHAPIWRQLLEENTRAKKILPENLLRQIPLLTVEMIL